MMLDANSTVKSVYGNKEVAVKGFNQAKEGHAPFMGKNKQKAQIAELNSL